MYDLNFRLGILKRDDSMRVKDTSVYGFLRGENPAVHREHDTAEL